MFPRLGFSGKRKRSVSTEVLFVVVMHGLERRPDVLGLGVDATARTNTTQSATPNSSGSTSTAPTPRPSTNRSPPSRTASSSICPMPPSSATASLSWSTPAATTSSRTSPACPTPSTASSSPCSRAAARAAKGNKAYENTIFLGFNGDKSACESILAGEETMSVAQEAYNMGYLAVEAAVKQLNGETLDSFIDSGCSVVTKDNAQARMDQLAGYLK